MTTPLSGPLTAGGAAGDRSRRTAAGTVGAVGAVGGTILAVLLSPGLPGGPRVHAATECDAATITWPVPGQRVTGQAGVYGSAAIDAFQFYKVEFASARAPEAWSATSDVVRSAARHARLDRWTTDAVADGAYRLKLTVVDTAAQERCRRIVENVIVANAAIAPESDPDATVVDAAIASADAIAGRTHTAARDPGAPWPTAAAHRAVLQATAGLTPTAAVDAAAAITDASAVTDTAAITDTTAITDTAAATAAERAARTGSVAEVDPTTVAALGSQLGQPFVVGFLVVAALMALVGLRAAGSRRGAAKDRR